MPLPSDERIVALSERIVKQFDTIFGLHPGFRPAHAKGLMLAGTFTPAAAAASLTRAPHALRPATPVTVRFSDSSGLPLIPDNDPGANPKGMAIRFHLAERVHTDIVSHSTDGFPTRTGDEFLELLQAIAASGQSQEKPSPVERFLGSHPAALAFVQTPKPNPASFATEAYFGVTAMRFTNAQGQSRHGRYRMVPDEGLDHLAEAAATSQDPNYLFDELAARIQAGPIGFQVAVQVADEGDVVDDATVHWPEERQQVSFGSLHLTALVADNAAAQKQMIFDPIPRVEGIDPSEDPLLELRAAVYLISGRRRRQA